MKPVTDGEADVPVAETNAPADATPENTVAPHTDPAAPDRPTEIVALALAVKPEIEYIATLPPEPVTVPSRVTVPPAGVSVRPVGKLPFVAVTLNRIKLGLPVLVSKAETVQVLAPTAAFRFVTAMFARAELGKIATSAEASQNTPAQ